MVKEGIPFVAISFLIALIFAYFGLLVIAGLFALLMLFMAYFFRDPRRVTPTEPNIIISAADGKVTRIEDNEDGKLVSVFLSPFDVHINRAPITGKILKVEYIKGKKVPATRNDASFINERNSIKIEGEKISVVATQIAGIVARRIVCWNKIGDHLEIGQKYGLIKFSSRTDLQMPRDVDILVNIGDRVVGGETIIGRFKPE